MDSGTVDGGQFRRLAINDSKVAKFCSNAISSTKYTFFTFLPLFLREQFHNYTNCFFLLVAIIQQFPEASFLGRYTTIIPLAIILAVSAIKEILEDIRRSRSDALVNEKTVQVWREFAWSAIRWKDIRAGQLIRVGNDEFFPADLLLLRSSNEDGLCYIETSSLDGENNLKIRNSVSGIRADPLDDFSAIVECDLPNEFIYDFKGMLIRSDGTRVPVSGTNLLLRGAALRNTEWIVGAAVYTGYDTKIIRNCSVTRLKRSSISGTVNTQIIIVFLLFLLVTFATWILYLLSNNANYQNYWYLPIDRASWSDGSSFILCLVFGVIYAVLIPISLTIMQEISRMVQASFICDDLEMYDGQSDVPATVKTSALNEDLGLVKYIFADKTGTLTKNVLEFKYCLVQDTIYEAKTLDTLDVSMDTTLWHFFVALTVGPGVIPVTKHEDISYFTSSPDQKALILGARAAGFTLISRTHNEVQLRVEGGTIKYTVLCDFEFTSERKRTSTIVRDPNNKLILYVVGSDDVIFVRSQATSSEYMAQVQDHVDKFASQGMRSVCVAMAKIDENEFIRWYSKFKNANEALQCDDTLMSEVESLMVRNLVLLGCTAVEDKLQDDVPETIKSLINAGINVWMLTGDKQETAINIAKDCQLLNSAMFLIILNSENLAELRSTVDFHKQRLKEQFGIPGNNLGLVVTGGSLKILFDSIEDVDDFINLMLSCKTVICCRTTPKQKALIVHNVQRRSRYVTLAIGDGANDVAMIQIASVGIGIAGLEGAQAANSADYAIGQFKYLKKLLLVHGSWSYNRICKMIFFIYYKNLALVVIQFLYIGRTMWSGQLYFDRWARMLYNVLLTSLPTLAIGIFEQSTPASELLQKPHIYKRNKWFNLKAFSGCVGCAVFDGVLLMWLPLNVFSVNVLWSNGLCDDYSIMGSTVYTSLLVVACLKSMLHLCHWTNVTVLWTAVSLLLWPAVLLALSHIWPLLHVGEDMYRQFEIIFSSPLILLYLVFVVVLVLGVDYVVFALIRTFKEPLMMSMYKVRPGGELLTYDDEVTSERDFIHD